MQGLWEFARLAWPACFMECLETWFYGVCCVLAGLLPNGAQAVAAFGVLFEVYDIIFVGFMAQLITLSTR